jgi:hypothetical protein
MTDAVSDLCRAPSQAQHSERGISERSRPFKTPEGVIGWRWRSRENSVYELFLIQPPWRGSELLLLVPKAGDLPN